MTLLLQVPDAIVPSISGDISWLAVGLVLVVGAIIVFFFLKNIVVNTILGIIGWGVFTYVFHINLPFWPSLIVSAIFGLAGLGGMVVLGFLGLI